MDFISEIKWRPTIGDPGFMGWFTVAAYAVGAGLAALVGWEKAGGNSETKREKWLWLAVAAVMAALCINKQLDLQSLLTDIGRIIFRQEGWYERRREFQKLFVVAVIVGAGFFGCWFAWRFREFWTRHKLLTGGALFLMTFIVVRAISFHHFDVFIRSEVLGVRLNWVFELTGILLITLAAIRELRKSA
ncbi:MAG TPA: hypothetical protein VFZ59_06960 [Verrucomicrobiae bacterium]|nr:hypothetical protein [Verrucomicrobiae bacterium]